MDKSLGIIGQSSRPLIANKDISISCDVTARYPVGRNVIKTSRSYSRLGSGKRVAQIGVWVFQDPLKIFRKSRTHRWGLPVPSFWTLIGDRDSLFSLSFSARYRGGRNAIKMRHSYSLLVAGKRVAQIAGGLPRILSRSSVNHGPIPFGIIGPLFRTPNRE